MIEAMACGTPVIAFRRGSAPEVIDDRSSSLIRADLLKREPILRP
jgi:glycosyltransferase involved in cell wall biosynthesis